jgi:hypothetical protein
MGYVYQEFPKMKYHPERGTTIVNNAQEEKSLGRGWYNNPGEFPKPSRVVTALENKVKPWWTKWQWIFAAFASIVAILGGLSALLRAH